MGTGDWRMAVVCHGVCHKYVAHKTARGSYYLQGFKYCTTCQVFLTVAAVTFSGGEEIGIYGSILATNNQLNEIITIVFVSMVLTGVWCLIAYFLANRTFLGEWFHKIGTRAYRLSWSG